MKIKNQKFLRPEIVTIVLCFCGAFLGCTQGRVREDSPHRAPGTEKMAALLERLNEEADPMGNLYISSRRAALLKTVLPRIQDPQSLMQFEYLYGTALMDAGQNQEALEAFKKLRRQIQQFRSPAEMPHYLAMADLLIGTAYLRIGEMENCQLNHSIDSCLMPIRGSGVHQLKEGSTGAKKVFLAMLENDPENLSAMWLLNIAAMTLGEYPDGVPEKWRIPESALQSDYDIQRFYDVAGGLGIDVDDNAGGGLMDDFNGDGYLDLVVSSWGLMDQMRFFLNNGDGTFRDQTEAAGLMGIVSGLNMIHADYNNDGLPDVFVLRGAWLGDEGRHPNSLLKNTGNGTFADVTEAVGVLSFHPTQTARWFDYDNDGWLDLFIGNESTRNAPSHPCELYHNNRDGTFSEVAAASGLAVKAFVKGVASGDYNNDGRPDLYLSLLGGSNMLFRNEGPNDGADAPDHAWKFRNVAAQAGVEEPFDSFPTWFWDYDNDGWLDLFVAGYHIQDVGVMMADYRGKPHDGERARLFRNKGDGTFEDVTRSAGLYRVLYAMGSNFGDLDNDGWLDFYVGTGDPSLFMLMPNLMFRNAAGKSFQDVTTSGGFGHLQKGHGISFGDIDEDGDQDVSQVMGGAYPADNFRNALFRNPGHGNHWLKLKLQGVQSNRSAIDARIKVMVDTPEGQRSIYRSVCTGGSFGGNPLRQEIGLGDAEKIVSVEIHWPASGITQNFTDLKRDHFYRITEGKETVETIELKPFELGSISPATSHGHQH